MNNQAAIIEPSSKTPNVALKLQNSPHPPLDSSFRYPQSSTSFVTANGKSVAGINIESYIPVGCLRIYRHRTSISPQVWTAHNSWKSFASFDGPTEYENAETLAKDVQSALSEALIQIYEYKQPMRKDICKFGWVRMEFKINARDSENSGQVRIFVLPDDVGRTNFPRSDADLRKQLKSMLRYVDISPDTFAGAWDPRTPVRYMDDALDWSEEEVTKELSLLHIFNHLPSPNPLPHLVKDKSSARAMRGLLANDVRGLYADLYLFQSKTAAMMLQREASPLQHLDPRLKAQKDQSGAIWYYNMIDGQWLRQPNFVDDPRGGILAEHMGRGYVFPSV